MDVLELVDILSFTMVGTKYNDIGRGHDGIILLYGV